MTPFIVKKTVFISNPWIRSYELSVHSCKISDTKVNSRLIGFSWSV